MRHLWKFAVYGRGGTLSGLFVASEDEVKSAFGRTLYFGEVLGKHSDVVVEFGEDDVTRLALAPDVVERVAEVLGETWSGFNPLSPEWLGDTEGDEQLMRDDERAAEATQ